MLMAQEEIDTWLDDLLLNEDGTLAAGLLSCLIDECQAKKTIPTIHIETIHKLSGVLICQDDISVLCAANMLVLFLKYEADCLDELSDDSLFLALCHATRNSSPVVVESVFEALYYYLKTESLTALDASDCPVLNPKLNESAAFRIFASLTGVIQSSNTRLVCSGLACLNQIFIKENMALFDRSMIGHLIGSLIHLADKESGVEVLLPVGKHLLQSLSHCLSHFKGKWLGLVDLSMAASLERICQNEAKPTVFKPIILTLTRPSLEASESRAASGLKTGPEVKSLLTL